MIFEGKKSRGQEVKQLRVIARRIYGRTSETSPDSEQIEPSVAIATLAKLCERGVNSRQSVSDAAIHTTPHPTLSHKGRGKKKVAFTLAEVLITLGIIGVVAALVIPFVTTQYQKKVLTSALMKSYSQINNAIQLVSYSEYEGLNMSHWTNCSWGIYGCFDKVFKKMNDAKLYPSASDVSQVMCYEGHPYKEYKYIDNRNGKSFSTVSKSARMPNGACVLYHNYAWAGDARGTLYIDVNGPYKGPNALGKDLFSFYYLVPNAGTIIGNGYQIYPTILANGNGTISNLTVAEITKNYCYKRGNNYNFRGCAAKILMDGWQMKRDYPW